MAHLTVAVSEASLKKSFDVMVKNLAWEKEQTDTSGTFRISYHIRGHLEGGSIDLRSDNTVAVSELDIRWDKLEVTLALDLEKRCVGGGSFLGIDIPRVCVFDADPDVSITLDFASLVAQEVSFSGGVAVRHYDASLPPPPGFDPCAALRELLINQNVIKPLPNTNQWHIFIDPETIDVDVFDFPDIVGDLIEDALTSAIGALIPGGVVRDLILKIIGGIGDLIRTVLDIPDTIEEWLSDQFNISFGLLDVLATMIGDFFGHCVPIARIDDPFQVLGETKTADLRLDGTEVTLAPVLVPIRNLSAQVNNVEMVVQADLGA